MELSNILDLLSATPREIMDTVERELAAYGYQTTRDFEDLFLFAAPPVTSAPRIAPMLVAHVDVVGVLPPEKKDLILNASGNKISLDRKSKAGVLGADDRAGIFAMFKILRSLLLRGSNTVLPFIVLTDKEEVGGLGARAVVASGLLDDYTKRISCYIELDRKGNGEFVSYDQSGSPNEELGEMFLDQGFKLGCGSYSDVADFTAYTGTSNVNLSVGYRNEHTGSEVLFLDEMELTISRVLQMWDTYPMLFSEVFEQEDDASICDFNMSFGGGPSDGYFEMWDEVYMLVEASECSDDIAELVGAFIDGLEPDLFGELVEDIESVVEDLSEKNIEVAEALSSALVTPDGEDEGKELDFSVDQRGAVACHS